MRVVDDPRVHRLPRAARRFDLASCDAAATGVRLVSVSMRDDAHHHVGRRGKALALVNWCARQRTEAFHDHGLLLQSQERIVGDPPMVNQVGCRGRQEDTPSPEPPSPRALQLSMIATARTGAADAPRHFTGSTLTVNE
jgi:hypothetical protein